MVLSLSTNKTLITISLVIWVIIGLIDVIITNIYSSKLFIQFYVLFPSGFPAILIYFIIAFISILINKSFVVIDYIPPILFGAYPPQNHWKYSWLNVWKSLFITFIATLLFGLSPLLCIPIIIYIFAKRAEKRMLEYPYANSIFGTIRDWNKSFEENIITLLPKYSNILCHNQLYLRCLFYTSLHLVENNSLTRKIYVNALINIMKVASSKNTIGITMDRELRHEIENIYLEYFVDKYFDEYYGKASIVALNRYAREYVYMLCYIFCIEIGLFWIITGILLYPGSYPVIDLLSMIWALRDIVHLILFVTIIWLYFDQIKSEIKYRYCWKHPSLIHADFNNCYEFMHSILWFQITSNTLYECIVNLVDINSNEDVKWMEHVIIEYCVPYQSSTNDVDVWYDIISNTLKYLSECDKSINAATQIPVELVDKYKGLRGIYPIKIMMMLQQIQ